MNYLSNAFSLQMLAKPNSNLRIREITRNQIPSDVISVIGHKDLANILGVAFNRVKTVLFDDDRLYVAQYVGGRLPEGVTELPEGSEIKFYVVHVEYPEFKSVVNDGKYSYN